MRNALPGPCISVCCWQRALHYLCVAFFYCIVSQVANAQVANDNIENRIQLRVEESITSKTTDCTVQRACVSTVLTGKRIVYHNDQWFEFTPTESGRYFVNLNGQHCRYFRGIQLVVMTGEPCLVATYNLLSCTSLGTQDDVFVVCDQLQAGQRYLLNVDGYGHDLCSFRLQVSRYPKGIPVATPASSSAYIQRGRLVQTGWYLPDSITATYCQVWRRNTREQASVLVDRVAVPRNNYGRQQTDFSVLDTLPISNVPTAFEYRVVAERPTGSPILIALHTIPWDDRGYKGVDMPLPPNDAVPETIRLPLAQFPQGTALTIVLSDALTGYVATIEHLVRKKDFATQSMFPVRKFFPEGARIVRLRIIGAIAGGSRLEHEELY
jgi:hypothetical protein